MSSSSCFSQAAAVYARPLPSARESRVLRERSRARLWPRAARPAQREGPLRDAPLAHRAAIQFARAGNLVYEFPVVDYEYFSSNYELELPTRTPTIDYF